MRPILAFWQFGSVGMLAWGAAAALPILIHLWSRRKYRQQSWAAMAFLLAALRKNARRIQLEQWVLLAVRTMILALFALALADPKSSLFSGWTGGSGAGQTHYVLVFDASYSMDYRTDARARFDGAKELAKQLVNSAQQGDGFSLVLMAEPPRVVIGQPAFDKRDVQQEIDNLELAHAGANLPATLAQIETLLRQAAERSARAGQLAQRRICIFTDLQQTTWSEVHSPDCRSRLARLESAASLELVDLGQPGDGNLAVARLQFDSAAGGLVAASTEIQIQADIQSFAREDRLRQSLEILVDGQRIADERIDCAAGARVTFTTKYRFDVPGEHTVEVHLADDALPLDNHRWLSVPVREAIRVLCIGGRPAESKHVALALAPDKSATQSIQVLEGPERQLLEADLAQFDCLVICNVGRFGREEALAIHRFVSRGGGLILFLGDQVQADSYNQLLADDPRTRVLPAQLKEVIEEKSSFNPLEHKHPIAAPFRGFPQSGLLTTPVWKYVRLTPIDGASTALAFENGDPAIVESQIGKGRSILVATAASSDSLDRNSGQPAPWTALPTWPSFPPLVHEMLRLSLAGRSDDRNLLVGDELLGRLPISQAEQAVTLSGPRGLNERLLVRSEAGESLWSYSPTSLSGIYEARAASAIQRFAVNVNPREGDLARIESALLPGQFRHESAESDPGSATLSANEPSSYFRWLLSGVLVLLLLEPCLAWWMGRGHG
jgi:Aerotolerance regulator N-terminal/von Willebrand factor type A domain